MVRTASREPQSLYSTAITLLPLWTVRPVQSLCASTRVGFFNSKQKSTYTYTCCLCEVHFVLKDKKVANTSNCSVAVRTRSKQLFHHRNNLVPSAGLALGCQRTNPNPVVTSHPFSLTKTAHKHTHFFYTEFLHTAVTIHSEAQNLRFQRPCVCRLDTVTLTDWWQQHWPWQWSGQFNFRHEDKTHAPSQTFPRQWKTQFFKHVWILA